MYFGAIYELQVTVRMADVDLTTANLAIEIESQCQYHFENLNVRISF